LELLVLRQTSIEGLTLFIEVLLVLVLGAFMGVSLTTMAWLYPLVFLAALALTLGASLFLCALVVLFSDLNYIWGVLCRLLFFLTPVFFSAEIAGEGLARWVLELNPLTRLIHVAREALLYGSPVSLPDLGLMMLGPLLVLAFGILVFRAMRAKIPDYI
jgi:ABC-type polysaccharide/polyol phosphate export permease